MHNWIIIRPSTTAPRLHLLLHVAKYLCISQVQSASRALLAGEEERQFRIESSLESGPALFRSARTSRHRIPPKEIPLGHTQDWVVILVRIPGWWSAGLLGPCNRCPCQRRWRPSEFDRTLSRSLPYSVTPPPPRREHSGAHIVGHIDTAAAEEESWDHPHIFRSL